MGLSPFTSPALQNSTSEVCVIVQKRLLPSRRQVMEGGRTRPVAQGPTTWIHCRFGLSPSYTDLVVWLLVFTGVSDSLTVSPDVLGLNHFPEFSRFQSCYPFHHMLFVLTGLTRHLVFSGPGNSSSSPFPTVPTVGLVSLGWMHGTSSVVVCPT